MEENTDTSIYRIQLMTLGDTKVGKTSILKRFNKEGFNYHLGTTIGLDYVSQMCDLGVSNIKPIQVKIWDTAGQERFHSVAKGFYQKCKGIFLVFDLTDRSTFSHIMKWLKNIQENADIRISKYLIGNKSDLINERVVPDEEAKMVAKQYDMKYFETSAKNNENINESIISMAREVFQKFGASEIPNLIPSSHSTCNC